MNPFFCLDAHPNLLGLFDTTIAPTLLYYSYIPIIFISSFFSLFVYLKNKTIEAKALVLITTTFAFWVLNEIVQWIAVDYRMVQFAWQIIALLQPAVVLSVIYFVYIFLFKEKPGTWKQVIILAFFSPAVIGMSTHFNISAFDLSECMGMFGNVFWYYVYSLEILSIFIVLALCFKKHRESTSIEEKKKAIYIAVSTTLLLGMFVATNIAGDALSLYEVNLIGPIGMVLFIAFLSFMIVRFKAFSVKLISAQALTTATFSLIFAILFIRHIENVRYVVIATLIVFFFISRALIKSVKKEIEAREEIEILATNLKVANDNQSNLIHVMNHQIKGRLGNSRNIFAELMTGDYGQIPDTARPLLEKGLEETTTGVNYVTTILKGASAESGTLPYTLVPMDFKALVTDVANKQQQFAERKGLAYEFKIEDGVYQINGDATQMSEAVKNLIDNSINYTPQGSISVSLGHKDGKIIFAVEDTGVGITDEDKQKLFRSGGRGKDSISINVNSTGYGLAFVKGVVVAHSGRVWAESEGKGKGSQFYIELPEVK